MPARKRKITRLIIAALILVVVLIVGIGGCGSGDRMFYWPNNLDYLPQEVISRDRIESVNFSSSDGTSLHGWFVPARGSETLGTVIYYHGNAQNMTGHYAFVSWLADEGYNLFLFDYRGFGQSQGSVSRKGIHQDSVAAMRYLAGRSDIDQSRVVAFGQSLGGACLIAALGEFDPIPVQAVAVECTFASYRGVARDKLATGFLSPIAWLAAQWLVSGDHDPQDAVARISPVPLLVMHGDADEIVPFSQGRKLYDMAADPKHFEQVPGGRHCDAIGSMRFGDTYRRQLLNFFAAALSANQLQ